MTQSQKSAIRVGIITTLLGGVSLLVFSKAAEQVVFRPEFDTRTAGIVQTMLHHDQKLEGKIDRILDVVCANRTPKPRACE